MPLYVPHVIHSSSCNVRTYLLLNKLQFFWRAPNRIRKCWYLCENVNTPTAVLGPHFFVSLMSVSCSILQMGCASSGKGPRSALVCAAADCGRRLQIYYWALSKKWGQALYHCHPPARRTCERRNRILWWVVVRKVLFSDLIRWLNSRTLQSPFPSFSFVSRERKLAPAAEHILFAGNYTLCLSCGGPTDLCVLWFGIYNLLIYVRFIRTRERHC